MCHRLICLHWCDILYSIHGHTSCWQGIKLSYMCQSTSPFEVWAYYIHKVYGNTVRPLFRDQHTCNSRVPTKPWKRNSMTFHDQVHSYLPWPFQQSRFSQFMTKNSLLDNFGNHHICDYILIANQGKIFTFRIRWFPKFSLISFSRKILRTPTVEMVMEKG